MRCGRVDGAGHSSAAHWASQLPPRRRPNGSHDGPPPRRIHPTRSPTHSPCRGTHPDGLDPNKYVPDRFWLYHLYKFFEYLATEERRREPILSPWVIGMIMIVVGLTGLSLAWIQNRQQMKALEAEAGPMPYSIAGVMAGFIAFLGGLALVAVAFRW